MHGDVDQVVIDVEAESIELRVACTMGTVAPVNWFFKDRDDMGTREEFIIRQSSNEVITAAGMDGIGSYSFSFNSGILHFGATHVVPTLAFGWECTE